MLPRSGSGWNLCWSAHSLARSRHGSAAATCGRRGGMLAMRPNAWSRRPAASSRASCSSPRHCGNAWSQRPGASSRASRSSPRHCCNAWSQRPGAFSRAASCSSPRCCSEETAHSSISSTQRPTPKSQQTLRLISFTTIGMDRTRKTPSAVRLSPLTIGLLPVAGRTPDVAAGVANGSENQRQQSAERRADKQQRPFRRFQPQQSAFAHHQGHHRGHSPLDRQISRAA